GFDPSSHQRLRPVPVPAAVAVAARQFAALAFELRALPGRDLRAPHEARPARAAVGASAPPVRGPASYRNGSRLGHESAGGPGKRQAGADCEPHADGGAGSDAMVRRVVVGANYGLRSWAVQRITAVVIAAYLVYLLVVLALQPPLDFVTWL